MSAVAIQRIELKQPVTVRAESGVFVTLPAGTPVAYTREERTIQADITLLHRFTCWHAKHGLLRHLETGYYWEPLKWL